MATQQYSWGQSLASNGAFAIAGGNAPQTCTSSPVEWQEAVVFCETDVESPEDLIARLVDESIEEMDPEQADSAIEKISARVDACKTRRRLL